MFFELSKTVGLMARPSNALILVALVGVLLMATRYARAGRRLAVAGVLLIVAVGFLPVGKLLMLTLEQRFPPWDAARGAPDGIIVLGGAILPDRSAAAGRPVLNNSAERMTVGAELARRYPAARFVFTGGSASLFAGGAREADFAAAVFEGLGVPASRVLLEYDSRNTEENAIFTKALVAPKPGERWLLVTSAAHMPRSVGVFRRAGFPVEPYPVDRRIIPASAHWPSPLVVSGLNRTDEAMKEWIGLMAYWVTGRTSALFPGPE